MVSNITYSYAQETKSNHAVDGFIDRQEEKMDRFPITCGRAIYYGTALAVSGAQTIIQNPKDIVSYIAVAAAAVTFALCPQLYTSMDKSREALNQREKKTNAENKLGHFLNNFAQIVQTGLAAGVASGSIFSDVKPAYMLMATFGLLIGEMMSCPSREEFKKVAEQERQEQNRQKQERGKQIQALQLQ